MVNLHQHYYFGHGKFLITGEYAVLFGARGLATPTTLGQSLSIRFSRSYRPTLQWNSYDRSGELWYQGEFEFWKLSEINNQTDPVSEFLQKLLREARRLNPHFLREEQSVRAETHLEFPLSWGLGSSSTLIYTIAQWAYVSPFALFERCCEGSGYDIACAQAQGPVLFEKTENRPSYKLTDFSPPFADQLFFVYTGNKQISAQEVKRVRDQRPSDSFLNRITELTDAVSVETSLLDFQDQISEHESLMGEYLNRKCVGETFPDFPGVLKSLGSWGGDFLLACSDMGEQKLRRYFSERGRGIIFSYQDIILQQSRPARWQKNIPTYVDDQKFYGHHSAEL